MCEVLFAEGACVKDVVMDFGTWVLEVPKKDVGVLIAGVLTKTVEATGAGEAS